MGRYLSILMDMSDANTSVQSGRACRAMTSGKSKTGISG